MEPLDIGRFTAQEAHAKVGKRIRTLVAWSGVPVGTEGVVYESYPGGVMIEWDQGKKWPLRDGFSKEEYEAYLREIA